MMELLSLGVILTVGGDSSRVSNKLTNIKAIYSTR